MTETNICDKCGDEYGTRTVFVTKGNFTEWMKRREQYENLCEPCENDYWDGDTNRFED